MRHYYGLYEAGETQPFGLIYMEADDSPTRFTFMQLDRTDNVWEENPDLIEYFIGQGGGDRAEEIGEVKLRELLDEWGAPDA